jgi:hypothetical protein
MKLTITFLASFTAMLSAMLATGSVFEAGVVLSALIGGLLVAIAVADYSRKQAQIRTLVAGRRVAGRTPEAALRHHVVHI